MQLNKNVLTFISLVALVVGVAWLAAEVKAEDACGE